MKWQPKVHLEPKGKQTANRFFCDEADRRCTRSRGFFIHCLILSSLCSAAAAVRSFAAFWPSSFLSPNSSALIKSETRPLH